jgi:hypothetical protein
MTSPFQPGAIVILYLREPRERVCGLLMSLDAVGVALTGMDLGSFPDWLRGRAARGEGIAASRMFYPMARVERILMDEGTPEIPGLDAQCRAATGRSMGENLTDETRASASRGGAS